MLEWWDGSPLATATWVDWLDIVLLAIVIYRVLVVMRGTRAAQSLIGLGFVGMLYLLSDLIGLVAVHWVLDKLVVYLVLFLLILFQDDLRKALARAGGFLFGGSTRVAARPSDANVMEEVIKAAFSLAHRKIGALMVIERSASLEAYVEGAYALDAVVSTELLQSVFHPSSPLHDGAVVLAKGRIRAAGVFLPISLSPDVGRWGTRHRAAIGLSEETDGLCVVVSEERGTVALVSRGQVTPIADANDLRQRLVEKMGEEEPAPANEEVTGARA
ncbi:MAG: TIGR00159 family protein [Alphaproteobacteria bacterium]|nr:TIGR00159 family protein [Alphaproteobacteria bacterium]MCB9699492.1 TIGR00159 family protein [Alphaproteobacteria bacterium]